jgi:hypothetical protein
MSHRRSGDRHGAFRSWMRPPLPIFQTSFYSGSLRPNRIQRSADLALPLIMEERHAQGCNVIRGAAWINVTRRTVWERRHDASAISGGFALTAGRFAKRRLRKWRHYGRGRRWKWVDSDTRFPPSDAAIIQSGSNQSEGGADTMPEFRAGTVPVPYSGHVLLIHRRMRSVSV